MAHFIATVTIVSVQETTRLSIENIYKFHGLPFELVKDRDTRFISQFWVALCHILGTRQTISIAFHP